jgi:hypothetical protein
MSNAHQSSTGQQFGICIVIVRSLFFGGKPCSLFDVNYPDAKARILGYMQLSSSAYWRSTEKPLNVNGGVRLFGLSSDSSTATTSTASQTRGVNANLGANYELSKHTRLNGSGNANVTDSNGAQTVTTNQTVGVSYQPDAIKLGAFDYTRFVASNISNNTDSLAARSTFR